MKYCNSCGVIFSDGAVEDVKKRGGFCPNCKSGSGFSPVGVPIKDEVDKLVEDNCIIIGDNRNVDSSSIKSYNMKNKKIDWEKIEEDFGKGSPIHAEAKRLFNNHFFRQFSENEINSSDYIKMTNDDDLGRLMNTDYPNRSHPKKRKSSIKNLIKKVVKWWRS